MDPIYIYNTHHPIRFKFSLNTYICHFIQIYFITAKNTSQKTKNEKETPQKTKNEKETPANFILSLKYKYKCWPVCLFWFCKCKM